MARMFAIVAAVLAMSAGGSIPARAQGSFAGWAAIVVAGDWHSHSGGPSEVFDNARRDVSAGLEHIGVEPGNLEQFSVRPDHYADPQLMQADAHTIATALWDLSDRTSAGCLVYMSSHGSPDGMVLGDGLLTPAQLEVMLNNSCAGRPTVVIISACFSGAFVPALKGANRFVLTAARADRTSFGCGDNDRYPFFDDCVLRALPHSTDFPGLAKDVEVCVSRKEQEAHLAPPSDPQLSVGANVLGELPRW